MRVFKVRNELFRCLSSHNILFDLATSTFVSLLIVWHFYCTSLISGSLFLVVLCLNSPARSSLVCSAMGKIIFLVNMDGIVLITMLYSMYLSLIVRAYKATLSPKIRKSIEKLHQDLVPYKYTPIKQLPSINSRQSLAFSLRSGSSLNLSTSKSHATGTATNLPTRSCSQAAQAS